MPLQSTPSEGSERRCAHCGDPFILTAPSQKYCTDACSQAVRKAYRNTYMRERRGSPLAAPSTKRPYRNRVTVICETCGKSVSKPASQAKAKHQYCSQECHNKAQERPVDLICAWCDNPFARPASLAHRQFCSNTCRAQSRFNSDPMARVIVGAVRTGRVLNGQQCLVRSQRIMNGGYSGISWQGRSIGAHVLAWMLTHGPIPDGMEVSHICHTPPCCELAHLILETHAENMQRSAVAGRLGKKVTS